jgi:molecular chaperone HscB
MTEELVSTAAPTADYFSVFSLPRKLGLDGKALERSFYRLSRELHPDRFAGATAAKQRWSLEQTSLLNDAYRTLKHSISRTEYLLRLEGITVADEKSTAKPPADLLEEVFELNMQLEEMKMNRQMGEDDSQLREDLVGAKAEFEGQLQKIDQEIERNWALWDGAEGRSEPALAGLAALLDRRRYVRNLVRDVTQALG